MIRKRTKDAYEITVDLGRDINGKRLRHYERIKGSIKEARAREAEIRAQMSVGSYVVNNNYTVRTYLDKWMKQYVEQSLTPKTIETYTRMAREVSEKLGHIKLKSLTPLHLIEFYNYLRNRTKEQKELIGKNKKLSETTILRYYALINRALNHAVKWNLMTYNPNSKVDRPKVVKYDAKVYDLDDVRELLKAVDCESLKHQSLIRLALDTGCRRGELTGLEWEDIDLKNGIVTINKSTQQVGKNYIEKTTKNNSSIRRVYISPPTIEVLKAFKKEQALLEVKLGDKWLGSVKVFTTDEGGNMHPDTPSKTFRNILHKYKLPIIRFHDLRHTSASLQLSKGINIADVSRRLGHSKTSTTLNIYSHAYNSGNQQIVNEFTAIFNTKEG